MNPFLFIYVILSPLHILLPLHLIHDSCGFALLPNTLSALKIVPSHRPMSFLLMMRVIHIYGVQSTLMNQPPLSDFTYP